MMQAAMPMSTMVILMMMPLVFMLILLVSELIEQFMVMLGTIVNRSGLWWLDFMPS
jgi:hypothetical protein